MHKSGHHKNHYGRTWTLPSPCAMLRCDRGATAIEYALIASLIAVTIVGAVTLLGGNLSNSYDNTASALKNS